MIGAAPGFTLNPVARLTVTPQVWLAQEVTMTQSSGENMNNRIKEKK
jgi:hypothetical protein